MEISCISNWAKSAGGCDIKLLHSHPASLEQLKSPLLFIGGVHGDEPEGVQLAHDLLEYLKLKNSSENQPDWILIPCLNMDGYKNNHRCNDNGVDLNRNFPSRNWSKQHKEPRYNPGPEPASEPEVRALIRLIKQAEPKLIIHFHSWNPCIVYTHPTAKPVAQVFSKYSSYKLVKEIGYEAPGSLGDYGIEIINTPVICIEEQEGCDLKDIWGRFEKSFVEILNGQHQDLL